MSSISDSRYDVYNNDDNDCSNVIHHQGGGGGEDQSGVLYGRDKEFKILWDAFESVASGEHLTRTVVVHGSSGVGKTALMDLIREPVFERGAYYCAGKFFQNSALHEPYSALLAALSDLCDIIGQQQQDDDKEILKKQVQESLQGAEGVLLSRMITNLSAIVGDDETNLFASHAPPRSGTAVATVSFQGAFKAFLRAVMSSSEHPLVLVLDDIQWMEEESRLILDALLNGTIVLQHVLLVLSYRDEEEEKLTELLRDKKFVDVPVSCLGIEDIVTLVSTRLVGVIESEALHDLAELALQRTGGNPFHASQFLSMLDREHLVMFDRADPSKVNFDVERIRRETTLSDSLGEVMSRNMDQVDPSVLETLKLASLMGTRFKSSVVRAVVTKLRQREDFDSMSAALLPTNSDALDAVLESARKANIIDRIRNREYQFCHDKIEAILHGMVEVSDRQNIHRIIGETYHSFCDEESNYQAAMHFNQSRIDSEEERIHVARMNLSAAIYCKGRSAFSTSAALVREGIRMIPLAKLWAPDYYELCLEMHNLLLRMEFSAGEFRACETVAEGIFESAATVRDTAMASVTVVEIKMAEYKAQECIKAATSALEVLGLPLPAKIGSLHAMRRLLKVKFKLRKLTDQHILSLPVLAGNDETALQVKVLGMYSIAAMIENDPKKTMFSAMLAMELCLQRGLSPYVASAFALFSAAELSLGNNARAHHFAELVLVMLDRLDSRETEAPALLVISTLVLHWQTALRDLVPLLDRCVRTALQTGNVFFASSGAANAVGVRLYTGDSLAEIEEYTQSTFPLIAGMANDDVQVWMKPYFQQVQNMRTTQENWRNATNLTGDFMTETDFVKNAIANHDLVQLSIVWICKLQLAYQFNFLTLAESIIWDLSQTWKSFRHHCSYSVFHCYGALTFLQLAKQQQQNQKRRLRKARKSMRALGKSNPRQCPNAIPLVAILLAVEKSLKKSCKVSVLEDLFNHAIVETQKAMMPHMEALANELAASCFAEIGGDDLVIKAERHILRALELYEYKWCATAKADWLREQYRHLLSTIEDSSAVKQQHELEGMVVVEEHVAA